MPKVPNVSRGMAEQVAAHLTRYLVMPDQLARVLAAWVMAAWLAEHWDQFPHVAITSPEKRCGKTLLLNLLTMIVPLPRCTTSISPAAMYRVIDKCDRLPTLLMDEAQALQRRGSEASETMREILNAGIHKTARVTRCGSKDHNEVHDFKVYCPKVFALIGKPDGVLADRCLLFPLVRKTRGQKVSRFRYREVSEQAALLRAGLEKWRDSLNPSLIADAYQSVQALNIDNDRMADLLIPLQTALELDYHRDPRFQATLIQYAEGVDEQDRDTDAQSIGIKLLRACREIFSKRAVEFLPTKNLISDLTLMDESTWRHYGQAGKEITDVTLGALLREYGIKSHRPTTTKVGRFMGYYAQEFKETWDTYLPALAD